MLIELYLNVLIRNCFSRERAMGAYCIYKGELHLALILISTGRIPIWLTIAVIDLALFDIDQLLSSCISVQLKPLFH